MRFITASIAAMLLANTAMAQSVEPQMIQQLEKIQGTKLSGQSLSMVMLIGTLIGCTQKQVGKDQTQAFYNSIEKIGKNAEELCKQNKPAEARQLMLNTFAEKKNDPVVKVLLGCYDKNVVALQQMAGPQLSMQATNYVRWVRDPRAAQQEMKESDICRNIKAEKQKTPAN